MTVAIAEDERPVRPLRVLHVLAPAGEGGLERVVQALSSALVADGHRVMVAAVVTDEAPVRDWLDDLRARGIEIACITLPSRAYRQEAAAIAELCRTLVPDVVHTHGFRPDVVAGFAAGRLGIPRVTTLHGLTGGDTRMRVYEAIQRFAVSRFEAVVAVSRPLRDYIIQRGTSAARVHLVPNAWYPVQEPLSRADARRQLGLDEDRLHLGWVGRLGHEKGADVAIEALTHLRDLPVDLSIVGDGRELMALRELAERTGVADRVLWHGAVPNASRIFPAFDTWLLSSRTEGTPIALFEAMAAGVPLVATRVGGVPDVVGDQEALLVAPEDPGALAAAARASLIDRAAARTRAHRAAQVLADRYAPGPWSAHYENIYRSIQPTTQCISRLSHTR